MGLIPIERFNLNAFWEKTPTLLKYILVFSILVATSYFIFSKKVYDTQLLELQKMDKGIEVTYELITNFEKFRIEQSQYNKEVLSYLNNLHTLIRELNISTNRKLDMIISSGSQNTDDIIERIILLNETFEKLSEAYAPSSETSTPREFSIGVRPRLSDTTKND